MSALRKAGASVQSLASVGGGCPDLLIGWHKRTYLVEVKDGRKPPSARALTKDEAAWIDAWRGGAVALITSIDEALLLCKDAPD